MSGCPYAALQGTGEMITRLELKMLLEKFGENENAEK